jgi:hypothetical protein
MLYVILYLVMLVASCAYALAKGGAPERAAVAILLAAIVATQLAPSAAPIRYQVLEWGMFVVDLVMLGFVLALAMVADRYWTMWWAALKINAVLTHLLMISPELMPWSYAVASSVWSFPTPLLIAIGALRHDRRMRHFGADPAWSPILYSEHSDERTQRNQG